MPKICVIGAGVIGLSSALRILELCPGSEVTVVADMFTPNTTTDVSGGFWEPHLLGDTPIGLIREWSGKTLEHMLNLSNCDSAKYVGASVVSGFQLSVDETVEVPDWSSQVMNFRILTKDEVKLYPEMKSGFFYTTVMIEPGRYLQWLMKRFQRKGGRMKKQRISSIKELKNDKYDVVVNCTGLGSWDLVKDASLQPVRGQVVRVIAPWIKQFTICIANGALSYILPSTSYVVLGGTEDKGNWNTSVDEGDKKMIWDKCARYVPSLSEATFDSDVVGLRPSRPSVRLEMETVDCGGENMFVVHNYGHGGAGVTLHWGCAEHAASLVQQALKTISGTMAKL